MEFSSKSFQRNTTKPTTPAGTGSPLGGPKDPVHKKTINKLKGSPVGSLLGVVLFVSAIILFIAIIVGISTRSSEGSYVQKNEYQAVFLDGGQVYFGKIKSMKEGHFNLTDIYYLNVNDQSVQPDQSQASQQNLSLVKLGCELHGPRDQMIINRDKVLFWENLKDESRVTTAIKDWQKQNKDGQKCEDQAASQPAPTAQPTESDESSSPSSSQSQSQSQGRSNNSPTSNNNSSQAVPQQPATSDTPATDPTTTPTP